MSRLMFAALASGSGKTTVTCAFLRAMTRRGLAPAAMIWLMLCVSNVLLSSSKKIFSKPSMQRFTNRTANFLTFVHPACRIPVN